jgi:hypothetical protein
MGVVRHMQKNSSIAIHYKIITILLLAVFSYLCWLMLRICLSYFPWSTTQGFLRLKQDVVDFLPWQWAFKIHVASSGLVLLAGFTQFFSSLRQQYPLWHRRFGWLYILAVFVVAAPSGFVLALYAAGGLITQVCFVLLTVLWVISTAQALRYAIIKRWLLHRDWIIRSFALSLSALSLRTWKLLLYQAAPYADWLNPKLIYQLEAWLGWVINLVIAELIIWYLYQHKTPVAQASKSR